MSTSPLTSEIQEAIDRLERIEHLTGRLDKESELEEGSDNATFKTLVSMAIGDDKYHVTAKLSDVEYVGPKNRLSVPQSYRKFIALTKALHERQVTGNAAKAAVLLVLNYSHPKLQKWFVRVLNHNLRIGVSKRTVQKVWGVEETIKTGLTSSEIKIKKDKCGLATAHKDLKSPIQFRAKGWASEPKLDGDHALIFAFPAEDRIEVYTRSPRRREQIELVPQYVAQILELADLINIGWFGAKTKDPLFIEGEFLAKNNWNETSKIVRKTVNFNPEEFLSEISTYLFDWAPLADYNDGKFDAPWYTRKDVLYSTVGIDIEQDRVPDFNRFSDNLVILGHRMVFSEKELWTDYSRKLKQNYEGSVVKNPAAPHLFKRSKDVVKIKPVEEATGTILKLVSGKGKNARAPQDNVDKVWSIMDKYGEVEDDGHYLSCASTSTKLAKRLRRAVNDSVDRRIFVDEQEGITSYRYGARLGYFLVETANGDKVRVGGGIKYKAGQDQLMEFWQKRSELVGKKIDYVFQGGESDKVALARFNKFKRIRYDLS